MSSILIVALRINLEALANQLLVDLVGLDVLEPDVAADRRAQAAMAPELLEDLQGNAITVRVPVNATTAGSCAFMPDALARAAAAGRAEVAMLEY